MQTQELLKKIAVTLALTEKTPLTIDTKLSDIWDSLGQVEILAMLQDEFKATLEMEELVSIKTVKDLIDILRSKNINFEQYKE